MKDVLNSAEMAVPLANFIQATGRFEQREIQRQQGENRPWQDGGTQSHIPHNMRV